MDLRNRELKFYLLFVLIVMAGVNLFTIDLKYGLKATTGIAFWGGAFIVFIGTFWTLRRSPLIWKIPLSLLATFLFMVLEVLLILAWGYINPGEEIF